MDKILSQLIRISHTVGKDTSLIQGGGGNTSVKSDDGKYMYIKASGTALKDMNEQNGWRRLQLASVLSIIEDKSTNQLDTYSREIEVVNRLLLACDDEVTGSARPSVETHLHAFLGKCVIHLHPVVVLAYACAKNGRAELEKLFRENPPAFLLASASLDACPRVSRRKAGRRASRGSRRKQEGGPPLWVPYADPGFMLARRIARLVEDYQNRFGKKPAILFLQKHGLLVSAGSPDAALQLLRKVIKRCDSKLKRPKAGKLKPVRKEIIDDAKLCIRRAFFEATGRHTTLSYFYDDVIAGFWRQPDAKKMLAPAALTPDELLYASGPAMWIDDCDAKKIAAGLTRQTKKAGKPPVAFLVKGVGLFVAGKEKFAHTIRDIVESSFSIRTNAFRLGGICTLNKEEQDFINQWEADAFRKELASSLSKFEL